MSSVSTASPLRRTARTWRCFTKTERGHRDEVAPVSAPEYVLGRLHPASDESGDGDRLEATDRLPCPGAPCGCRRCFAANKDAIARKLGLTGGPEAHQVAFGILASVLKGSLSPIDPRSEPPCDIGAPREASGSPIANAPTIAARAQVP